MEPTEPLTKARELLNKYKYALLILALGLILMLLPEQTQTEPVLPEQMPSVEETQMEQLLTDLIRQIDGAGETCVLLSQQQGSETFYQTDTDSQNDGSSSSDQSKTVIITDSDRNEQGLVRRTDPPKYLGAVIVCQGADIARVRLAIVEAVQCATGLGANQICVVKMK